ncbi:MAG: hypothetical protein JW809_01065 [Pirellulales bacterium]|nr:hypothetical protein [Pirellulales bacterium]
MKRSHHDSDTLVLIAVGLCMCGLALPYVMSQCYLGYLAIAAGVLLVIVGVLRRGLL